MKIADISPLAGRRFSMPVSAGIAVALLTAVTVVHSETAILSDDFNRAGALRDSAPAVGSGKWAAEPNFTTNPADGGAADIAASPANESRVATLRIPEEYLTGHSLSMGLYQMSAQIDLAATHKTDQRR